ncbi:MAG: DNA-binding protein [Xanthobacteraceae bacterium]|jgi:cold shock CspA family protein/ribosome-associated translation inhibitor RaiA|nr:DNA-binding protein [Xanthobacteraceae bacterium]
MQVPLEIAFQNVDAQEWAENDIRERVADLERIYDRIISCRVRVQQRATNRSNSIPPVVHIDIGLPGQNDIVVSQEPERLLQKFQHPDLHNAIHEAFRVAEQRLISIKEQQTDRSREWSHEDIKLAGQVAEIVPKRDFGFLLTNTGGLLYFHREALLVGDFDTLQPGDEVFYVEADGDTGPIATNVRTKATQ